MVGASGQLLVTEVGVIVYGNLEVGGRSDLDKVNISNNIRVRNDNKILNISLN